MNQGSTAKPGQPDLYLCDVAAIAPGEETCSRYLTDLSVDAFAGEAADVQGAMIGASEDGSYVYFVADGILETSPGSSKQVAGAVHGDCGLGVSDLGVGAVCNVYVRHGGVTRLVAVLSAGDLPDWNGLESEIRLGAVSARVSPDGRWLAFMSRRSLTRYNNLDAVSGRPDEEVFEYHAPQNLEKESGTLTCVSCDPTGARPVEAE